MGAIGGDVSYTLSVAKCRPMRIRSNRRAQSQRLPERSQPQHRDRRPWPRRLHDPATAHTYATLGGGGEHLAGERRQHEQHRQHRRVWNRHHNRCRRQSRRQHRHATAGVSARQRQSAPTSTTTQPTASVPARPSASCRPSSPSTSSSGSMSDEHPVSSARNSARSRQRRRPRSNEASNWAEVNLCAGSRAKCRPSADRRSSPSRRGRLYISPAAARGSTDGSISIKSTTSRICASNISTSTPAGR